MRSPIVRRLALLAIAFWGSTASAAPERHQTRIQPLVEGELSFIENPRPRILTRSADRDAHFIDAET